MIQTASTGARIAGHIELHDLNSERRFSPVLAYGSAKLANILFTIELHRRYHGQGISSAAFHPGTVASNFGRESESRLMRLITQNRILRTTTFSDPDRGADQLVWLATSQAGVDWESGVYYEKRSRARRVNPQVRDPDLARGLWAQSELMVGAAS